MSGAVTNTRRRVVSVLALALIAAACITDSDGTTTSADGDGTGMSVPEAPDWSCFYLDGYVVVEERGGDEAISVLGPLVEPVSVAAVLGDSAAVEQIDANLDLLSTSEDPLDVAQALVAAQIAASPVHAMGLAGHWALKPGTDPISRPGAALPDPTASLGDGYIAVVDSGIVVEPLPDWMSPEHVLYDPNLDTETIGDKKDVASHGTFIAALIRRLAPEFRVAFARARPVPPNVIVENEDLLPPNLQYISTELHVAEAIVRLTQRPELTDRNVAALNLSLGTYTCDPGNDPTMVTTLAALRLWFTSFPSSRVFAAGGNEEYVAPFWPAGLSTFQLDPAIQPDWVRGMGAVNETGAQVIWSGTAAAATVTAKPAPPRVWVTHIAPGCDLLSLRGGVDAGGATVVAWSGSSFASAVTAALDVAAVPPTSSGPPVEYDYTAPDLQFEQLGSCDLP
jgi:hypothetical protein